ncbi:MAG: J domain-containing protein [Cocleimonas sp.]|nr:J domain-containing protein [Cocleimonas sp.]
MKSEAIRYAIKLNTEPALLARFGDSQRKLPRGITELLRIVSSDAALKQISKKNNIDATRFRKILLNYVQKILLQANNSDLRMLGLDQHADNSLRRLHYRLLMNIFHPDKFDSASQQYTQLISKAYKNIKNERVEHKVVNITRFASSKINSKTYQQAEGLNHFLVAKNNNLFVRKSRVVPVFTIILITSFVILFAVTLSSPQVVVKKMDSSIQGVASRVIDLQEEKRRSIMLSIRDQQNLSKK